MPNNLLVPCGTSQLDEIKLEKLLGKGDFGQYKMHLGSSLDQDKFSGDERGFCQDPEVQEWSGKIAEKIVTNWYTYLGQIGMRNNPIGAEISTLAKLQQRDETPWDSQQDRIILFASQTQKGLLAREVLLKVITAQGAWAVPARKMVDTSEKSQGRLLETVMVNGMVEDPTCPDQVLETLALKLTDYLLPYSTEYPWNNILISSGGFKSIIPVMTLVSLLYGVEMVYMFEASHQLISLHPRLGLQEDAKRDEWNKVLSNMKTLQLLNRAPFFDAALFRSAEHPEASWSLR
jgi:hypothetical protein